MNDMASTPLVTGPDFWLMILKSMGMLCLVLGLLIGLLYLLKRLTEARGVGSGRSMIRLLSSFHLTPKEKVVLLDVMGRKLLIGVTGQSITPLMELPADAWDENTEMDSHPEQPPLFKHLLARLVRDNTPAPMEKDQPPAPQNEERP
jgi:flagellar protein FliO/FliZ